MDKRVLMRREVQLYIKTKKKVDILNILHLNAGCDLVEMEAICQSSC